eukprot:207219-Chlamydomonas_euryale.AAC.2
MHGAPSSKHQTGSSAPTCLAPRMSNHHPLLAVAEEGEGLGTSGECTKELEDLKTRFSSQADELQRTREKCLPRR